MSDLMPVRREFDFKNIAGVRPLTSYIPKAVKQEEDEHARMGFVEGVFDLLSRGQYVTANVAEDLTQIARGEGLKSWDRPIARGLTGKRKGDWTDVLWGSEKKGQEGWFDTQNKLLRGATGFAANVLLDPLTYLTFGATSAARKSAQAAAQGAVRRAAARGQTAQRGVQEALGEGAQAREMHRVYNEAYRRALRGNSDEVRKELIEELRADRAVQGARRLDPTDLGAIDEQLGRVQKLDDEIAKLERSSGFDEADYLADLGMGQVGERSVRFMGMNLPGTVSQRAPNRVSQQFIEIGDMIRNSKVPGSQDITFADAWWKRMNTGAIGAVRQAFGFRNPYQRALREIELSNKQSHDVDQIQTLRELDSMLGDYQPDEHRAAVDLIVKAEEFNRGVTGAGGQPRSIAELMNEPDFLARIDPIYTRGAAAEGAEGTSPERVMGLYTDLRNMLDGWQAAENNAALEGLVKQGRHRDIYLPLIAKLKSHKRFDMMGFSPTPTRQRAQTHAGSREQESARLQFMTGMSADEADEAVRAGQGIVATDLTEMMTIRALVHQKIMARASMLEKMREFGVHVDSLRPPVGADPMTAERLQKAKEAMQRKEGLNEIGLFTIDDPAVEGYLFDSEVHDIMARMLKVTESPESIETFRKAISGYTGWWKSVVTTSPGFHLQNVWSNTMTMFWRLGPETFDPRRMEEAFAGTAEMIGAGVGIGEDAIRNAVGNNARMQSMLGRTINGYTLRELAEYAHRSGIINEFAAHVGNVAVEAGAARPGAATTFQRLNPFSAKFGVFEGSRQLGTFVESTQRFQLFLGNVKRVAGDRKANAMELEWAKLEAKKWLIDYGDLTRFEEQVMQPMFPFYTWVRRSVPLAMQQVLEDPGSVAVVAKAGNALMGESEEREDMPRWLRQQGAVVIGEDTDDQYAANMGTMLRMMDLVPFRFEDGAVPRPMFKGGTEVLHELAGNAHPALRATLEETGGRDLFWGRDLDKGTGKAPRMLQIFRNSPEVLAVLDGAARVWAPDTGMGWSTDARGRLRMDPRMSNVLSEMVPVLDQFADLLDGPRWALDEIGVPIEAALESATGAPNEYDGMQEFLRALGVRLRRYDPEGERLSRSRNVVERARRERRQDRVQVPLEEWRERQRERYARIGVG